ncbi:bleomycin resistance protein [Novosphingobium aquiterrae]|uniref:Bleomycin resistance protein n=1 Tax=Novosphingobium aquiterrae TaxID=624388 RepID=A0ABV6PFV1_9SPHN
MDHATPNLPARDFSATSRFYAMLGFTETWHDAGWMIIDRGSLRLEFFPYPELDPTTSSFGTCLRLDDLEAFVAACAAAGIAVASKGFPRLHRPAREPSGLTIGYLVDLDGTLLRLIQN